MPHARCLRIPEPDKASLDFLFLAKHALSDGTPDEVDGTHATYHRELGDTLDEIGLRVTRANSFDALLAGRPAADFLITLYNRAGFRASEMLAPLLAEYWRLPYMGGAPMVRGLSDDKHFMKRISQALGVRTPEWRYFPNGVLPVEPKGCDWEAFIVKPNASSASWGISLVDSWGSAIQCVLQLHDEGHDVIVERFIDGFDLAQPLIGAVSPWFLPPIAYGYEGGALRSYEEKRDLTPSTTSHNDVNDADLAAALYRDSALLVGELWPFDHGRLEFRLDARTGEFYFIEVNLNCNLWSKKTIAAAAQRVGVSHSELIETILCHSLIRQGLIGQVEELAA